MAIDYVELLEHEAALLAAVATQGPLDAPVPACPGWDVARLTAHVGRSLRWATVAVLTRAEPGPAAIETPPRGPDAVGWFEVSVDPLLDALRNHYEPNGWNFMGAPDPDATFWSRREAVETAIHRWDAEQAVGGSGDAAPIDAVLAVGGIEEQLFGWGPFQLGNHDGIDIGGSVHIHCIDIDGEWTLKTDDGVLQVDRGHAKGDVALRGPASSVLLVLWRRLEAGSEGTEVFGDSAVLDRWLALGV